jgi:hypothetical protein
MNPHSLARNKKREISSKIGATSIGQQQQPEHRSNSYGPGPRYEDHQQQ